MTNEDFILLLSQRYYKRIYQYAKHICIDKDLTEDIVQETFLAAYQNADRLQKHDEVLAWLYQTARYKMLKMVQNQLQHEDIGAIAETRNDGINFESDCITILDLNPEVRKYLNTEELDLFIRHYEQGYGYVELAEEYHISQSSIKMRMQRIRKRLQKKLKGSVK